MRTSSPGRPGPANAGPWRRWLFPAAIAAGLVTLLALPRGTASGQTLTYTRFLADVGAGTVRPRSRRAAAPARRRARRAGRAG